VQKYVQEAINENFVDYDRPDQVSLAKEND
jgi:hypothetical protein